MKSYARKQELGKSGLQLFSDGHWVIEGVKKGEQIVPKI